jgi:hypothetical protein
MKKYLILLMFVCTQAFIAPSTMAASLKIKNYPIAADALEQFVGRYKLMQGTTALFLNIYEENGKLVSKQLWDGLIKPLDHVNGDNFMVTSVGWSVKFIRDKNNKVKQMQVAGHDIWSRVADKPLNTDVMPPNPKEYVGKYQTTTDGKTMALEISLKNGKLWGTQLWDGGNSQIIYTSDDTFLVLALDCPVKFIRNSDKKIAQLLLNSKALFTRVNIN